VASQLFIGQEIVARDNAYVSLLTEVMPTGLLGLCLAGLLAAIMSSVDSGLCACGSLLTYDFFAKIKKNATEKELLKDGRIIMVVLLIVCMLIAPFIRNFKGLFDYLLAVWAFLAPGVFVTVLFGLFYKRSTEKAAFSTLCIGCVLGFFAFCLLNVPALAELKSALPAFLQNKLNLSPWITLICAVNMYLMSNYGARNDSDDVRSEIVAINQDEFTMTPEQIRKYRKFLIGLLVLMGGTILAFSPLVF
jgi:SSS family solute:Na+ symporter